MPRAVAFIAAFLVAMLALAELKAARDYGAYLSLNSLLRRHEAVSDRAVMHYAQSLDGSLGSCRTDILEAVVSVAQRDVDLKFIGSREEWPSALARSERVLRAALGCNPTNGDLWMRLAVTRWLVGGSADEQLSLMTLSQTYSPSNLDTVTKRLLHWGTVTPQMAALGEDLIRRDIRTILLYAPETDAVGLLRNLPAHLHPLVRSEAEVVPRLRLDALKEAGFSAEDT
jgi:hypothetical protein